ncbi:MAG: tRNA pseudouridine(55) synthase TruB [Chloroflexia bacterium]
MEGFLNLNKPAGPTSHDIVEQVRRLLHRRRVGHGGTLDPLAEGVLPIALGRATRLLPFLHEGEKVYRATVALGVSTTTYDAEGEVTATRPVPPLDRRELEAVLSSFQGEIEQVPPPFSAVRQGGRRLYRRARAGEEVQPPPRRVRIFRLTLLSWEPPHLSLEVACGGGTYIRSLAHDLGERLGCGAHLRSLVRFQVGPFRLEEALRPEELAALVARGRLEEVLLPSDTPVRHWPAVVVEESLLPALLSGRPLALEVRVENGERVRAYGPTGRFLALLRRETESGLWRPFRVFPE